MNWPQCCCERVIRYRHNYHGKQRFRCQSCGRQFVPDATGQPVSPETRARSRSASEGAPCARRRGPCCPGVGAWASVWPQSEILSNSQASPDLQKKPGRLTVEMDEMWSFLGSKNCPVWLWQAIDQDTCIDCRIPCWRWHPSRSKGTVGVATRGVSTVCSLLQGFLGSVQTGVAREAAPWAVGGLNHTFRQRVGRLVRKTLSFSKKLDNHIGAIWLFVHEYNASLGS